MAVFNRNRWFLLTILLIAFCSLHNNSEAEAAAATLLSKNSIDPPFGNSLIRAVDASGVQIYKCEKNSSGIGLVYTSVGAMATLSSPDSSSFNGKYTSVGYHYFLSEPLAQGGKPTFSFSMKAGEPISAIPESTVTCNVLAQKMLDSEDVDDLLLKAVSHSARGLAIWVSYVQRMHSKGGVPPSSCEEVGKQVNIPYTAQYLFWQQDRSLPMGIPVEISVSKDFTPLISFYSEGIQYYRFNGSSWINFNVSAYLYTSPGQEVVGWHYFSTKPDQNGGQPTWELFMPFSRVTVKVVSSITVDSDSIDWTEMEATSHGGNKNGLLQNVKYMQRVSTVGGLPPQITAGSAVVGDEITSPFSTIYWFYV
jgi:hypothetical protein